jgi:methylisocitrate lyase
LSPWASPGQRISSGNRSAWSLAQWPSTGLYSGKQASDSNDAAAKVPSALTVSSDSLDAMPVAPKPDKHASPGARLRESIGGATIQIPGAISALTAKMIARASFPAMYLSGAAFSAGTLGIPDIGLLTLSELAEETARLARAADIPLVVDADTGFGETANVARTVELLAAAGAAAIQLEDQVLPKRCGHLSGKTLVTADEMCQKIRAATTARDTAARDTAARGDDQLVILARTDARGVEDFDAAVERARRYVDAGADWIFPEALSTPEEFARFAELVDVPLVANMTEFGRSPLLTVDELSELGYAAALYPVTLLRLSAGVIGRSLDVIRQQGTQRELIDQMQTRQELYDTIGYEDYDERDRRYFREGDE